jgi:hypothetical protein
MNSKSEQTDPGKDEIELLRQALRDQEAEITRLRNVANEYNQCIRHMSGGGDFFEFQRDITAHLGGEHER